MVVSGVARWSRRVVAGVSGLFAAALVVSGLPVDQAWGEDPPSEPAPQVSTPVASDVKDFPSALVEARATGERVEITAERSEASTTWVNPDGTVTTQQFAAPVRFQDESGAWQKFDTTLVEQADGSITPVAVPGGVVLAGEVEGTVGDPAVVAEVGGADEASVAIAWEDSLADPVLKGSTATYAGAWPGIDLVVHATRDGFEQSFLIAHRDALLGYVGVDSIVGANATAYSYPTDPVNSRDVDGRGPFGSCFARKETRVVQKYWSRFDGTVKMQCGTKKQWGLRHIRHGHGSDWKAVSGFRGSWTKFLDWAIREALYRSEVVVSQPDNKRCYSAPMVLYKMVNGKPQYWKTRYTNVVVSKNNRTIISAFPSRKAWCK